MAVQFLHFTCQASLVLTILANSPYNAIGKITLLQP